MVNEISTFKPDWFDWPQVKRVLALLDEAGIKSCFVGGCVRDAIADKDPNDFDLIVDAAPGVLSNLFRSAGIKNVVTDEAWDVVDISLDGLEFDFIYAYGRRIEHHTSGKADLSGGNIEKIAYSWAEQADFTLNAIYLLPSGELHNHFGGVEDVRAGCVRFFRVVDTHINWNFGHVLRFFRFLAWFGKGDPAVRDIEICTAHAPKLLRLPRWAIQKEMRKLLSAPNPEKALALMHAHGIFKYVIGFPLDDLSFVTALMRIERIRAQASVWQVRLASMLLSAPFAPEKAISHLVEFWTLDDAARQEISTLLDYVVVADADMPVETQKELSRQWGKETLARLFLLRWAMEDDVDAARGRYMRALETLGVQ